MNQEAKTLITALEAIRIAKMGGAFPRVVERLEKMVPAKVFAPKDDRNYSFAAWQYGISFHGWALVITNEETARGLEQALGLDLSGCARLEGYVDLSSILIISKEG